MTTKKYDLAVKVGSYTKNGEEKARYVNVGMVMEKDDGGTFILLNRTFNPAGVPNPDNKDSIIISQFEPRDNNSQQQPTEHQKGKQNGYVKPADLGDDDLPF